MIKIFGRTLKTKYEKKLESELDFAYSQPAKIVREYKHPIRIASRVTFDSTYYSTDNGREFVKKQVIESMLSEIKPYVQYEQRDEGNGIATLEGTINVLN